MKMDSLVSRRPGDEQYGIVKCAILPKLRSDLQSAKIFVETDAVFLNIGIEGVKGYVFHERHNRPDEAEDELRALRKYFEDCGHKPQDTEYGFYVIL